MALWNFGAPKKKKYVKKNYGAGKLWCFFFLPVLKMKMPIVATPDWSVWNCDKKDGHRSFLMTLSQIHTAANGDYQVGQ